jgi:hypothetical protein
VTCQTGPPVSYGLVVARDDKPGGDRTLGGETSTPRQAWRVL